MSDQESPNRLALQLVIGPIVALTNQGLIYASSMWACGHDMPAALHIIPALCLIVVGWAAMRSFGSLRQMDRADAAKGDAAASHPRFLALCGTVIGGFSAAVIVAQWVVILVFGPCMHS
jgi:hypothetical protein